MIDLTTKTRLTTVALAPVFLLGLAACGDTDEDTEPNGEEATEETEAPEDEGAEDPQAAADTVDEFYAMSSDPSYYEQFVEYTDSPEGQEDLESAGEPGDLDEGAAQRVIDEFETIYGDLLDTIQWDDKNLDQQWIIADNLSVWNATWSEDQDTTQDLVAIPADQVTIEDDVASVVMGEDAFTDEEAGAMYYGGQPATFELEYEDGEWHLDPVSFFHLSQFDIFGGDQDTAPEETGTEPEDL